MRSAHILVPLLLASFACAKRGSVVVAPAPPRVTRDSADTLPSLPPGTIVAPLSLDLAGPIAAMERTVPHRFGRLSDRLPLHLAGSNQASFAFEVRREPFRVSFAADTIVLAAVLQYQGRAWLQPSIGPSINGGCGTKGEPRRARLVLRAVPHLSEGWRLQAHIHVAELAPLTTTERDRCEVSFLSVNVTGTVLEAARNALEKKLPALDRRIAAIDVRSPLEHVWIDLQHPIRLTDSLWLVLQPTTVHLGTLHGSPKTVTADLGISAAPRIVTGKRPELLPVPLPPLGTGRMEPGFSLPVEGALSYGVMSGELTRRLTGRSVRAAGGELRVKGVTVYGTGAGRLALGLDFDGTASGRVWLVGTPSFDAASGMVSVPDLDFDATSAGMLVQGVAWLKGSAIRDFLRRQARVSAGEVLSRLQELAVSKMNRPLARGVQLSATIERSEPAGILVRSREVIIRARATGTARLDLGPELFNSP